jgi:RNA polymerase-binding transcription factor DksA
MRQNGQRTTDHALDGYKFKLTRVLDRLTSSHRNEEGERTFGAPDWETAAHLALFCRRNLAANRSDWVGFLTRQVSDALERIEKGSYGYCLQCGQPVEVKRLAALPWVASCVACQERNAESRMM